MLANMSEICVCIRTYQLASDVHFSSKNKVLLPILYCTEHISLERSSCARGQSCCGQIAFNLPFVICDSPRKLFMGALAPFQLCQPLKQAGCLYDLNVQTTRCILLLEGKCFNVHVASRKEITMSSHIHHRFLYVNDRNDFFSTISFYWCLFLFPVFPDIALLYFLL